MLRLIAHRLAMSVPLLILVVTFSSSIRLPPAISRAR
jgi:hypothetical protein